MALPMLLAWAGRIGLTILPAAVVEFAINVFKGGVQKDMAFIKRRENSQECLVSCSPNDSPITISFGTNMSLQCDDSTYDMHCSSTPSMFRLSPTSDAEESPTSDAGNAVNDVGSTTTEKGKAVSSSQGWLDWGKANALPLGLGAGGLLLLIIILVSSR